MLGSYDVSICAIISVGHDAGNGIQHVCQVAEEGIVLAI
jgi:hypothetical protein